MNGRPLATNSNFFIIDVLAKIGGLIASLAHHVVYSSENRTSQLFFTITCSPIRFFVPFLLIIVSDVYFIVSQR